MEYKLIQATDAEALESRVTQAIQEGFIPCGGVSVVVDRRAYLPEHLYTQAMTRQPAPPLAWDVSHSSDRVSFSILPPLPGQ